MILAWASPFKVVCHCQIEVVSPYRELQKINSTGLKLFTFV